MTQKKTRQQITLKEAQYNIKYKKMMLYKKNKKTKKKLLL